MSKARGRSRRVRPLWPALERWVSALSGGVYTLAEQPAPQAEIGSAAWAGRGVLNRGRRVEVDAPWQATFTPEPFRHPHPRLAEHRWAIHEARVGGTFALEIPQGRTLGARGAVVTDDNLLISDLCDYTRHCPQTPHFLLAEPPQPMPKLRRRKGVYALLNSVGTSTYHWILDTLPRYEVLRRAGYDLEAFDGFFLRRPKYEAHLATVQRLGIPEEKIIWCTKNSHFGCDRLVVPSFTNNFDVDDQKDHHPWVFPFLRGLAPTPEGRRRRLLINRKDSRASTRQVANQAGMAALLARYGFEEVTLGDLDFAAQARCFAEAEFVVAAHGGGLANLCFCDPSTKVIELFAPD